MHHPIWKEYQLRRLINKELLYNHKKINSIPFDYNDKHKDKFHL